MPPADEGQFAEFEWLYGADAEEKLSEMADAIAHEIAAEPETAIELAEAHSILKSLCSDAEAALKRLEKV